MVASSAICDLLYQLGISANYKGFLHTAYAVSLCVEQQDRLLLVTKWLYPDVARKYGTNWKAVERNIFTKIPRLNQPDQSQIYCFFFGDYSSYAQPPAPCTARTKLSYAVCIGTPVKGFRFLLVVILR